MTTMTQDTATVRLRHAGRVLQAAALLHGGIWWLSLSAGGLLALVTLDEIFHLPAALRLPLAILLGGFVIAGFYLKILLPLLRPVPPARAARMLEISQNIQGNVLINAYHFEKNKIEGALQKFVRPVLASSATSLDQIRPRALWVVPGLKKWFLTLLLFCAAWGMSVIVFPRHIGTSMTRIFMPLADVPPAGNWDIVLNPSKKIDLIEGDKLEITAHLIRLDSSSAKPPVPTIIWKEGTAPLEASPDAGDHASMIAGTRTGDFVFKFSSVTRSFHFRVLADDSYSISTEVRVKPLPRLKKSAYEVTPPAYTGLKPYEQPGPPMALSVPIGSTVHAEFETAPQPASILWKDRDAAQPLKEVNKRWQATFLINESRNYEIQTALSASTATRPLCQGQITAVPDRPPEIDFVTEDRNRIVNPGSALAVTIHATDDYGVASVTLKLSPSDDPTSVRVLKTWTYIGPPGEKEPLPETWKVSLDPGIFTPGSVFLLTAEASDFSPAGQHSVSRPILLRVTGLKDLAVPQGDALERMFTLLKNTISEQTKANGFSDNLAVHLQEALAAKDLPRHHGVMLGAQQQARDAGNLTIDETLKHPEGKPYLVRLQPLIKGEMELALGQIQKVPTIQTDVLPKHLTELQKRQTYILNELISILGQIATERQEAAQNKTAKQSDNSTPPITTEKFLSELKDDLKAFAEDQKRIIQATKSFKELHPEDLTSEQEAVLGELAREEAKKAAFFQEKLTDFSKLPIQDFADGKLVGEMDSVFQEVQKAADALYQKNIEIAVPKEEAGLEKASDLEQNLERWLPNTPDNIKWSMEEAPEQSDAPMAELPKQLEDIVGDLLDKEEDMGDDVQDVSSTFMDSIDKGAGWGAGDGPISNMSAKGVTGNQLPNNNEVGGRSGEGRSGKSSGQMVGDTAEGKGGRQTPTRLSATPFEAGSVNDTSKDSKGGATGGGKLSGSGEDGLHGPLPPPAQQKMKRLAEQQSKLRQQAESLALQLRKQRKPSGELETAVNAMRQLETAAQTQNGVGLYQGYHQALDALASARKAYSGSRLSRVESDSLNSRSGQGVTDTQAEEIPSGYEEMTGAYFRSLSESHPDK